MINKLKIIGVFNLIAALAIVGCGSGDKSEEARVRVFHASPDAPNVDVLVDGGKVLEDVPFKAASDFLAVDPGDHRIQVNVAGTNTSAIDAHLVFAKDSDSLIVAAGKVASIGALVFPVDRTTLPAGTAKVRVLHAAPSAPKVDVYVTAKDASINDTAPVLSNVPFKAISEYLSVPAGIYDVAVTIAGTKSIAIKADGLNIPEGLVATVAALDTKGGGSPFMLQVLNEQM
jgi:hypothetical protein